MAEAVGSARRTVGPNKRLADAIRDVKNAAADRQDVVVELREASRTRLELLAAELAPIFEDVPVDVDLFDFTISSGLQPRLWIDSVSHVAMGRDRRTYRFVRDTRIGRVVLAESAATAPVVDQVTRYVAERLVERERLMEGGAEPAAARGARAAVTEAAGPIRQRADGSWPAFSTALCLVLAGAIGGFLVTAALLWGRMSGLFG
jgi:hypothetical protein